MNLRAIVISCAASDAIAAMAHRMDLVQWGEEYKSSILTI
jgi:hypothetical protein